jgi:hypothetical protein
METLARAAAALCSTAHPALQLPRGRFLAPRPRRCGFPALRAASAAAAIAAEPVLFFTLKFSRSLLLLPVGIAIE